MSKKVELNKNQSIIIADKILEEVDQYNFEFIKDSTVSAYKGKKNDIQVEVILYRNHECSAVITDDSMNDTIIYLDTSIANELHTRISDYFKHHIEKENEQIMKHILKNMSKKVNSDNKKEELDSDKERIKEELYNNYIKFKEISPEISLGKILFDFFNNGCQ